jgi:hypothetical protein
MNSSVVRVTIGAATPSPTPPAPPAGDRKAHVLRPISPDQRAHGVVAAARSRAARARLLSGLRSGALTLAQVWAAVDADKRSPAARTRLVTVLRALPGIGEARAQMVLSQVGLTPDRRLAGLGQRQRDGIAAALNPLVEVS